MLADGTPELQPFATARVEVGPPQDLGDTGRGIRRLVPIIGGSVQGRDWHGLVRAGGIDYQWITGGTRAELEARYVFDLSDGHQIYVVNHGIRTGSADALSRVMRGAPVAAGEIYSFGLPSFETNAPALQWISDRMFVATGRRLPDCVELRYFMLA